MKINEKNKIREHWFSINFFGKSILVSFTFVFVSVKCTYTNMLKDKESCGGCA